MKNEDVRPSVDSRPVGMRRRALQTTEEGMSSEQWVSERWKLTRSTFILIVTMVYILPS